MIYESKKTKKKNGFEYKDPSKFEIKRNGDGSINMIIKNVINYIEK